MAPPDHNGPFVQNDRGPGLLRRLFSGGAADPAAPHQHTESSTSEMHDRAPRRGANPTPVATPASPRTGGNITVGSILLWILRRLGLRLTLAAVAGILVLIGTLGDDGSSAVDDTTRGLQELRDGIAEGEFSAGEAGGTDATTPGPSDARRGTFRVTVDQVMLDHATFTDARGKEHVWNVEEPLVYGSLALNLGEQVLVYWEERSGAIFVVGVDGPRSRSLPGRATDAA